MDSKIEHKFEFLYASIEDARDTIRAIDQKVNFLFVGLAIPLSGFSKILGHVKSFYGLPVLHQIPFHPVQSITIAALLITWSASFFLTLKALASSEDPSAHIPNDSGATGVFYSAKLFEPRFLDLFRVRKDFSSKWTLAHNLKRFNLSTNRLLEELIYEHMKLVYLRDLKRRRQITAYRLFFIWVVLGGFIWGATLIHT